MTTHQTPCTGGARIASESELRRRFLSHRWFSTSTARRPPSRDEWDSARFARRSPGLAVWCLVLMLAGTRMWTRDPFPDTLERDRAIREARQVAMARSFVYESLDVIGHRVRIANVAGGYFGGRIYGFYDSETATIAINLDLWEGETRALFTAAHESVHALFQRITGVDDHTPYRASHELVEETTASVLGAYIAGRVWEQRGHDGEALTRRLISEHRDYCDPTKPHSLYQEIAESQAEFGSHAFSPEKEWSMHIHFGSTALVDDIDAICRAQPSAWAAANAIIEKYMKGDSTAGRPTGP